MTPWAELERQLRSGVLAHLAYGSEADGVGFGGASRRSKAPEPVEHQWQRIVDALPDGPAERAAMRRRLSRNRVRHGLGRLRAGNQWRWQRPLATVRVETAQALRELGHQRLARSVDAVEVGI